MVAQWLPEMKDALYAGHSGNDGSAMAWANALRVAMADLHGYQGHGSWATPHGALITWAIMMQGGVQINKQGERFHDETQGYSEAAVQVLAQPGGVAWSIFDEPLLAIAKTFPDFCQAQAAGAVKHCPDVAEFAQLIGCGIIVLTLTLNQPVASSGRVLSAPYYAIKVTGALFHTQGGIDINERRQALTLQGLPLPNLLAAGGRIAAQTIAVHTITAVKISEND